MANFNRRITLNTAVQDVMGQMGLLVPADVMSSTEKNAIQFKNLANIVGEKLINENVPGWQILSAEWVLVTDGVTLTYDLPDDWDHFVQDASWNRTTRMPAFGSLIESEWAMLKARNLGGTTFAVLYIVQDDQLQFYSVGTQAQTLVFPYISRGWAKDAIGNRKDRLTANDDVILYDPTLFKAALKLAWQIEKGFDSSAAQLAYNQALNAATGKEAPGRTLTLGGATYPFIGGLNLPITGYGA